MKQLFSLRQGSPLWVACIALAPALITAIGFRWVGAIAGVESFGRAMLFNGILQLVCNCSAGSIGQALMQQCYAAENTETRAQVWASAASLAGIVTLAGWLGLGCWWGFGRGIAAPLATEGWALALALPAESFRTLSIAMLAGQGYFRQQAWVVLLDACARPLLVLALAFLPWTPAAKVLWGYALGGTCSALLGLGLVYRYFGWGSPQKRWILAQLRFALPLLGNSFFLWLSTAGDRYFVAASLGTGMAGIYLAAMNLGGRPANMLGNMPVTYFRPPLYQALADHDLSTLRRVAKHWLCALVCLLLAGFILLWIAKPWLLHYVLPPDFRHGASRILLPGFLAYALMTFSYLPECINYGLGRTWFVAGIGLIGALAMMIGVYLGARWGGLPGVALGLGLAGICRIGVASLLARVALRKGPIGSKS